MPPENHRFTVPFSYDNQPSVSVIEAVAWAKGVEPEELEPLHNAINPDALNTLVTDRKRSSPTVTFRYEAYDILVDAAGHIIIREVAESIYDRLDHPSNILVLENTANHHTNEACADLLRTKPPDQENLLSVTYASSSTDRYFTWHAHSEGGPANLGLLIVGDFTRSTSPQSTNESLDPGAVRVETVADPTNLSELEIEISERLTAWQENEKQTVMCFRSLTDLLQHVETPQAIRFLHRLTRHIASADAVAHYHLNPTLLDDETVETLKPLFDCIIKLDDSGAWRVEKDVE